MKMTDIYPTPGRPVAYYPKLAIALNSINAALLVCQFVYWWEKGSGGNGWVYKSAEEIEKETGLTYEQQITARKRLKMLGLINENYHRRTGRMYFRIDPDRLQYVWDVIETHSDNTGTPLRKSLKELLKPTPVPKKQSAPPQKKTAKTTA